MKIVFWKVQKFKDLIAPFELWGAEEITPTRESKKKKINTNDNERTYWMSNSLRGMV